MQALHQRRAVGFENPLHGTTGTPAGDAKGLQIAPPVPPPGQVAAEIALTPTSYGAGKALLPPSSEAGVKPPVGDW